MPVREVAPISLTPHQLDTLRAMFPRGVPELRAGEFPDGEPFVHAAGGDGPNSYGVLIGAERGCLGISWGTLLRLPDGPDPTASV